MTKAETLQILKKEVLRLQEGSKRLSPCEGIELGPITAAFPQGHFPCACLHELLSDNASNAAATTGFIAAILGKLTARGRAGIWISTKRQLFAPGLAAFGLHPDQVLFISLPTEKQSLWAAEEAVKCEGLGGVIIETSAITDIAARRLQLAAEKTGVTCLLHRNGVRIAQPIASAARWRISALPSEPALPQMPGIGATRWNVRLEKIKNGRPGEWTLGWFNGQFETAFVSVAATAATATDTSDTPGKIIIHQRKAV